MMSKTNLPHLTEDDLELYSLGRLSEPQVEKLEEHLLVCEGCQDRLTEADDFVRAIRVATEELRLHPEPVGMLEQWRERLSGLFAMPGRLVAVGACALLAVLFLIPRDTPMTSVELTALRGFETAAQAPATSDLDLRLSLEGVNDNRPFRIQIADTSGRIVAEGPAERTASHATMKTDKLPAGSYYVRLQAHGETIREYALNVR